MRVKAMWNLLAAAALTLGVAAPLHGQSMLLTLAGGGPQVKDDLLAGTEKFAQGASDVTDVNLDSRLMGMLGKQTVGDIAKKLDFVVVRSYSYDKPGMYRAEDVEAYQKRLTDGSWVCFVHVRERKNGESTDICSRQAADHVTNELVIIAAEPQELTFVHIRGRMSIDDLRNLGNNMGGSH
jgi:hypothetical protein